MKQAPTRQRQPGTVTGPLVAAIEQAWAAIQARHPDVPDVVLTLGNGSTRPGQLTLGHFHARKWASADDGARLPELFVGGEGLAAGPRDLLGTLLHEAVHGVAAARGIRDTSRQGRYHNARYRELATEHGIAVARDPRIGWSLTTVPDITAEQYRDEIAALGAALTAYRLADVPGRGRTTNNGLVATCECDPPRKIRLSRTAYDTGPIVCGVCAAEFTATDPDLTQTATRERRVVVASRDDQDTNNLAIDDLDTADERGTRADAHTGIDQDDLDTLVAGAAERRATAANRHDELNRLRDMLLRDEDTSRRRSAVADPAVHQHNALINSQAVHPTSAHSTSGQSAPAVQGHASRATEPDRAAGPDDRDHTERGGPDSGDAALARAQVAVELLTARRRALDAQRQERARSEQLNRWHRDDHTAADTAAPARGDLQVGRDR